MRSVLLRKLPILIVAMLIGSSASLVNGLMSLKMMDIADFAISGRRDEMIEAGIVIVEMALGLFALSSLLTLAKGVYRRNTNVALRRKYLSGVFGKNINEFNKDNTAVYVSGITNDLNTIDVNFVDAIFELVLSLISFIIAVVVIARVNYIVLLVIAGLASVISLISFIMSKRLNKMMADRSALYERYTAYLSEVLSAFRIIKSNNLTGRVKANFHDRGEKLQSKSYDIDKYSTYIFTVQNGTIHFLVFGVLLFSAYLVIMNRLTFGGIILIMTNLNLLLGPFQRAGELLPKILSSKAVFESLDSSLRNKVEYEEDVEFKGFTDRIVFNDVGFAYEDKMVLDGIDLEISKGRKYLVTGPSGGGKSTLLKILRKYHYPQKGEVLIDGTPLRRITRDSYFRHIGNVDQNIFIFDDTIRNNLTLYRDCSEDRIIAAIHDAGLDSFVDELSFGLDTVIKDNGRNISGGERSRIAIARALLEDVDLLLLDEAFANLDAVTAGGIERTILEAKGLTVVNVSHLVIPENRDAYDDIFTIGSEIG
ncbi:MAG: ABC transporter ATP-binding protein [Eubacteriales bacterium]|nr:ABC transporter ATP-binding protein [Eubacteriales bacterium]